MKFIASLMFIISLVYGSGCTTCSTKKINCPAFDDPAFAKWFPYNDSSRMLYKNITTADTFSYAVSMKNISGTYETSIGSMENADNVCHTSAYFSSSNYNNSPNGTFSVVYDINNQQPLKSLGLHFNNGDWIAGEIFENSFGVLNYESLTSIDSAQNVLFDNGITYQRVVILTNDTSSNKTDRAYKLFIAKNIGIIGCEMFPSKQKWVIQ